VSGSPTTRGWTMRAAVRAPTFRSASRSGDLKVASVRRSGDL